MTACAVRGERCCKLQELHAANAGEVLVSMPQELCFVAEDVEGVRRLLW